LARRLIWDMRLFLLLKTNSTRPFVRVGIAFFLSFFPFFGPYSYLPSFCLWDEQFSWEGFARRRGIPWWNPPRAIFVFQCIVIVFFVLFSRGVLGQRLPENSGRHHLKTTKYSDTLTPRDPNLHLNTPILAPINPNTL